MAEPDDMIIPLLREMRVEIAERFSKVDGRLDAIDQRIELLERKVRELETPK